MKLIPLTQGKYAIVDDADYGWLAQWKWNARQEPNSGMWYASHTFWKDGRREHVLMHRMILGLTHGDGIRIDHRNLNRLDNQRHNLRHATASQNALNAKLRRNNTSRFKGVTRQKNRWRAKISIGGRRMFLGSFETPEAAYRAYCNAALSHCPEFARLS